jgi:hypothetical protein
VGLAVSERCREGREIDAIRKEAERLHARNGKPGVAVDTAGVNCTVSSACGPSRGPLFAHLDRRKPMKPMSVN